MAIPPQQGDGLNSVEELTACRFSIDDQGIVIAVFKECSGLSGEIEVETYQEGGLNEYEHKLPGRTKYGNVTLKSGVANSVEMWSWFHRAATGDIERRGISIVMYQQNRFGQFKGEAMRWTLSGAYPVRWEGPSFSAEDNSVAVQSIELAHNGITMSHQLA